MALSIISSGFSGRVRTSDFVNFVDFFKCETDTWFELSRAPFLARAKINPHEILSQFQVLKYPPILIDFKFSKLFRFGNLAHLLRFKWISNQMIPLTGSVGGEDRQLLFVRDSLTEELSSRILFMVLQKIDKNLEKS